MKTVVGESLVVVTVAVSIIFLQLSSPTSSTPDFLAPFFAPLLDNVCKEVECGQGSCKPTNSSGGDDGSLSDFTFPFECECKDGWKKLGDLKFLPCIIPNCTLDFSCSGGAAPAPSRYPKTSTNSSVFDPCVWNVCGGHGTCNKNSSGSGSYSYACSCSQGYSNLMNVTTLPCLKECAIGGDCQKLGISMFNQSTTPPPSPSSSNLANNGSPCLFKSFSCPIMFMLLSIAVSLQM